MTSPSAVGQALAATNNGEVEEPIQATLMQAMDLMGPQIARALPNALDPDRFVRIVLTEIRKNPVLQFATQASFLGAVMAAAQLGLEFGPLGFAYLVPFRSKKYGQEAQLIVGYKGLIDLHLRSGKIRNIVARQVYERDVFKVVYDENGDHLIHEPYLGADRGPIVRYYGRAVLLEGGSHLEIMELDDIKNRRNRSNASSAGPWVTDEVAMSCKTVVRKMSPWLPASPMVARALELDENVVHLQGNELVITKDEQPPGTEHISLNTGSAQAAPDPEAQAEAEALCEHGRSMAEECDVCNAEEAAERQEEQSAPDAQPEPESAPAAQEPPDAEPQGQQPLAPPAAAAPAAEPIPEAQAERNELAAATPGPAKGARSLEQAEIDHILAVVQSLDDARVTSTMALFEMNTRGAMAAKRIRLYQRICEGVQRGEEQALHLL